MFRRYLLDYQMINGRREKKLLTNWINYFRKIRTRLVPIFQHRCS